MKERPRNQWGGYGKQYGTSSERRDYQTCRTDRTQLQSHNTAYESQRQDRYLPTKGTGSEQGGNGGNGDENDKKKFRDTRISQESDSHEESDTEDSYEFEITSQQLSQVTPGGGALKIKLSKKKPLKITAGASDRQLQTIPMELERISSSKRPDPRSQVDTTSESTLPTRGLGAPLFIPPIHLENNERPQRETSTKRENDLKGSTNYGLTKELPKYKVAVHGEVKGQLRVQNPPRNGGGGDSPGGTSEDHRFPGEGRGPPGRNNNQAGGGDDDPDPSDDGDGDDSSSTDSSAPRKRKHKSPKYVYVLQGPPGPKGQEGQPGQAGRDGRDGQNFTLTKELEETLRAHRPNLDTTGLENSFDQFG